jgi:predicted glycoside hydrolase/deacetylase ChbG (UPF0249 family)
MKEIIVCADDYGVSSPVGKGIRELIAAGRLSAVSCMSTAAAWPAEAALLKPFRDKVEVGLHFNLTLGEDCAGSGLRSWLIDSLAGRIDRQAVGREFLRQLDRFESAWGEPPDFVDGHQHVHVFPGIRQAVLRVLAARYPMPCRPWLRQVNPPLRGHDAPLKALVLKALSCGFAGAARRAGVVCSEHFAGLYSLSPQADYPAMMACWLRRAPAGTVLMCHPGMGSEEDPEGIGRTRLREFRYLGGRGFAETLGKEGIALTGFRRWREKTCRTT